MDKAEALAAWLKFPQCMDTWQVYKHRRKYLKTMRVMLYTALSKVIPGLKLEAVNLTFDGSRMIEATVDVPFRPWVIEIATNTESPYDHTFAGVLADITSRLYRLLVAHYYRYKAKAV